ncbi:AAA family ATPase [Thermococcus thermotolerans]|uniref:AAA family ATPase n=1 Tax=Thermococcus thermotolerans TaxID=2969672 RepID=UPI002157C610|nr:ATP-binding protein [Thermococcus thermotolerans]
MFSTRPVRKEEELFGEAHKRAIEMLWGATQNGEFVAVLGPRRVGKTSVINVFLNKYGSRFYYLYYDLAFGMGREAISYTELTPVKLRIPQRKLEYSALLNLGIVKMDVRPGSIVEFQNAFLGLLRFLNKKGTKTIIVFDEAQVLPRFTPLNMLGLLQTISDSFENISVVLTGSMPGLLERVINPSGEKPFFARYVERINIERWNAEEGFEYLRRGLPSAEPEELREAATELSGVPGFLAYYGKLRTKGLPHSRALEETMNYAVRLWSEDLRNFIRIYHSPGYIVALKRVAKGPSSGTSTEEIITEVKAVLGLSEVRIKNILRNLVDAGLLLRPRRGRYVIPERPLRKAVLRFSLRTF